MIYIHGIFRPIARFAAIALLCLCWFPFPSSASQMSPQNEAETIPLVIDDPFLDAQIDRNRRVDFELTLRDADGQPYTGPVRYEQIRHDFEFGTAIAARMTVDKQTSQKKGINEADWQKYESIVVNYFNAVVAENAMKWCVMEDTEGPRPERVATAVAMEAWARERNLKMRGHTIFWGVEKWLAEWTRAHTELPPDQLAARMQARLGHVLSLFDGRINEWDLNNEMMHEDVFGTAMGWENGTEYFKWAKAVAPNMDFYVNDFGVLQGFKIDLYVEHIRELLDHGAAIGGIGDQAHFWRPLPSNESLWEILD